jgi:hypothetical protein
MLRAIAGASIVIVPVAASTTTSASAPRPTESASFARPRCFASIAGSGCRDGAVPRSPSVRGAKKPNVSRPTNMPMPAAPKPQCQLTFSPSAPATS